MSTRPKLGIIGLGNMGGAIASGVVRAGLASVDEVVGHDPNPVRSAAFVGRPATARECAAAEVLLIAVKPHIVPSVCEAIDVARDTLVISVAAGVPIAALRRLGLESARIVRAMPNTAAALGASTTALFGADEADREEAARWMGAVGRVVALPREDLMHAATALVGSGPAFLYALAEAMADGGVHQGLPRAAAQEMVAGVLRGAAALLGASPHEAALLKDAVASPGGTTIAGLRALELAGGRAAVLEAVVAASMRSRELAEQAE